jgi:hypothetical protein
MPTAVVRTRPSSVCLHDDHRTTVVVDASESAAGLTLVPVPPAEDAPELAFAWSFAGDAHELASEPTEVEVSLTTAGERPLHITLSVTNALGGTATSLHTLPLTIPAAPAPCDGGGCPVAQQCVTQGGEQICVPAGSCLFAADCPVCFRCDDELRLCVPEEPGP